MQSHLFKNSQYGLVPVLSHLFESYDVTSLLGPTVNTGSYAIMPLGEFTVLLAMLPCLVKSLACTINFLSHVSQSSYQGLSAMMSCLCEDSQ